MKNWRLEEKDQVKFYRIKPFSGLNLVFTTRIKGWSKGNFRSLNLSYDVGDDPRLVDRNYRRVKKALGIKKIFSLKQVHSNKVFYANSRIFKKDTKGDGLFTNETGLAIGVKVADCLPIYIFDKRNKVIGIAHAGWRSTLSQIGKNLVSAMTEKFGLSPSELNFALGPCIEQTCYEVGFDLLSQFFNNLPGSERFFVQLNRKIYFDLRGINRFQLKELGLNEFGGLELCTKSNSALFYSVRSSRVAPTKRQFDEYSTLRLTSRRKRRGVIPDTAESTGRNLALIYLSAK